MRVLRGRAVAPLGEDYHAALAALQARGRFGVHLGLGRTRALLHALGDPHLGLRGALIGGTNGKGSVQALVAAALAAGGLRVAQTPKPHLVTYRERIVVGGQPITADDFAALLGDVLPLADGLAPRLGPPTEFEVLTAAAFAWFARQAADVAVVEVGLGGRLDATNAWDGGVAAITNVDLDHTDRLGPTVEAIAREKAPIIKRGDRAVTGARAPALAVIRRRARTLGVPLAEVARLPVLGLGRDGTRVYDPALGELRLGLIGRHQAANAAVALATLRELAAAGIASGDAAAIAYGFANARWPGRMELLTLERDGRARPAAQAGTLERPRPGAPDVILDGAHNGAGAAALATAFDELRPSLSPGRPTILFGVMADKDLPAIVAELVRSRGLRDAAIVAVTAPGTRAASASAVASAWRAGAPRGTAIRTVEQPGAGLDAAIEAAIATDGPLLVAGSLYLVGAVRERLFDDPALRDPPQHDTALGATMVGSAEPGRTGSR